MDQPIENKISKESLLLEELLNFFKALADSNRLKIVGLLAQQSYTVEQLADFLSVSVSTMSHHLSKLAKAGLVSARPEGHYYRYTLQADVLHSMAQRLLNEDELPKPSTDVDVSAYDRKVLAAFIDAGGRIKAIPAQEKKFQVLLRHVVKDFEPGVRYSEKQVNETLSRYHEDTAILRRGLIEYTFMDRSANGREYWLLDKQE